MELESEGVGSGVVFTKQLRQDDVDTSKPFDIEKRLVYEVQSGQIQKELQAWTGA